VKKENAIGKIGKVYLSIPEKGKGLGQVQVIVQGRLKTLNAVSSGPGINTGEQIIIFDINEDRNLIVEPYKEE